MITKFIHIIIFIPIFVSGQTKLFNERLAPHLAHNEVFEEIVRAYPTQSEFCPINGEYTSLEAFSLDWMKKSSRNRRFKLQKSSFLKYVSDISVAVWANSYFYTNRELKTPKKQIKRALPKTKTKYGLVDCFSFSIPLIHPVKKRKLKYDYKGTKGELNLYIRTKVKNEDGETEIEKIPVTLKTEEELVKDLIRQMNKNGITKNLRKGVYYSCAISIQPDPRTFGRSRVPHARVFIVLGAKRLHFIKEPNKVD